jgi:hypothetical protein
MTTGSSGSGVAATTKSAKKIWEKIKAWDSSFWWQNVVKFEKICY